MRFGILGPLRARRPDGVPIPLGGPRLRALLAMLLLDAGRPVPIDRLIDGLYGQEPPLGAANALQAQVSRLRRSLPVELGPAGYRLAVPPGEVDAHRFAALAADGHQALADGDPDRAAVLLTEATGIWTGDPLIDVRHAPFAGAQVTRLTEARLTAVEDLQEAELQRIGPLPPGTVPVLRDLTTTHPLRERPHALLMRALTATGRPAEALSVYETIRRALADELGADPSPELTALHIALLRRATPAGDSPAHRPHLAGAAPRPPSHDDTPADQHRRTSLRPPIPPITSRRAAREEIETPHETAREQHETPHRIAREQHGSPHPVAREQHESPHPATREEHGATHQSASEEGDAPHQVAKERGDAPHQVDGEVREPGATTHQAAQDEHGPRTPIRHGVPSQVNSFVGRDDEVTRSVHTLSTRRLVTLHGPGGAGKTRLAAEIAARHDGDVYFTELAAAGPDEVPRTVLAALGLRDVILNTPNPQPPPSVAPGPRPEPSSSSAPSGPRQLLYARPHSTVATDSPPARDVMERLVTALGERRLLLVLDNCEHVVEAAAELTARLLSGTPGVRVLATSREPLGIPGEVLLPVGGLPVPPESNQTGNRTAGDETGQETGQKTGQETGQKADPEAGHEAGADDHRSRDVTGFLRSVPSVRLFLDRAADVVPDFALTAENAPAIARLCRTLDGLPLAVELAAARLQALPVAEIEARLGDRFRLLAAGRRTVPRHRTLQAVVAWSWDLLTGAEQVLARRFTVFAGSADLDAIEKVCRTPDDRTGYRTDDGEDVVEVLAGLVAKSLIERDGPRYRMLATIRAFCAAHLTDSGERDRLYHAHADHFLALALRAGPFLRSADQLGWLVRLDADRDNLQAAVRRSTAHGAPGTALRLVSALCFYWWLRGLRLEAAALSDLVLRVIGPEPPPGLVEEYVVGVFTAALGSGPVMPAARWSAYLLSLSTAPAQPFLLYLSAMAVGPPDSDPAGIAELNRRLRDQVAGDPWCRALGGIGGGWVVLFSGADPALAEPEFRAALDGFRVLGDRWGAMLALSGLAELAVWRADPAAAIPPTVEALRLAGELGSTIDVADLLRGRGQARMDTGDLEGAAADFSRAAELAREAGAPEMVAAALLGLGSLAMTRGGAAALAEASRHCRAALSACPSGWYSADGIRMTVLVMLGRIAESSGDPAAARARYREVFTVRSGIIGLPVMVEALERLAALTADPVHAARLLGAAHTLGSRAGAGVLPAAAFAEGSGLSPEQITALVRADIRP